MKTSKQPVLQTRMIFKIVNVLVVMSKLVCYCPWVFDKTTGEVTIGKFRTWVIPFIFLSRFFGFIFLRFTYFDGIASNPFLMLSLIRGSVFSLNQFYYTIEVVLNRKRACAVVKEIEELLTIVNPRETILKRVYWETIISFSIFIMVLTVASSVANNFSSKSISGFIGLLFYCQYLCATYVFDCHVIVLLRLTALLMNTLSKNIKSVSYTQESKSNKLRQLDLSHLGTVGELRVICRRLFDLKDSLALCFRTRLVSSSFMIFVDLAFFVYATYTFFRIESNSSYLLIIGGNCWVALNFIKLFYMTHSGQTVETAATTLSADLMQLVTVNTPRNISVELLALSQELMHRTPCVNIGGMFKLNDGLAISIISTSFTYIMILLQFDLKISTVATASAVESLLTFF